MSTNGDKKDMMTESALTTEKQDPGFWREAWQQARLVFYLLRDKEVPFYLKLLPFFTIIYVISPLDLMPGGFDDVTLLLVGAKVFIELSPQHVVIKHLNTIRAKDGYDPIDEDDSVPYKAVEDQIIIEGEVIEGD